MRVYVELAHQLDPAAWRLEHQAGRVPNLLPFGLETLEQRGMKLEFRRSFGSARVRRQAMRVNRLVAGLQWCESAALSNPIRRRDADVVLGWDEWTGVPAALRGRLPGEPPVVSGIMNLTDWPELQTLERRILAAGMHAAAALYQHSGAQADILVSDWGVERGKITIVPFGVDPEFFSPQAVSAQPGLIVSVGDDRHRDYPGLLSIFRSVRQRVPHATLDVHTTSLGAPPSEPGVQVSRAKLGPLRPNAYSAASVVAIKCHPQVHGSGLSVIVEAMACGRPWVATDSVGFREHFANGDGGILVPENDRAGFADAVSVLLEDPAEANRLGRIGRTLVEQRLNTTYQNNAVADLLEAVVR